MQEEQKKKCIFAGTFDPPTLGHESLIKACLEMFDEVVVAIMINPDKTPYFSLNERMEMLQLPFRGETRIRFITAEGTMSELLERENTKIYVRGIRNSIDLDYENANFYASKKLDPNILAVYLPCPQELLHVSSTIVRNSLKFGTPIDEYVSQAVKEYIENKQRRDGTC